MKTSLPGEPIPQPIAGEKEAGGIAAERQLSAEASGHSNKDGQEQNHLLDRTTVLTLAAGIRTCLRFHQEMGIESYPMAQGLIDFLSGPGNQKEAQPLPVQAKRPVPSARPAQPLPARDAAQVEQLPTLQPIMVDCQLCAFASAGKGQVAGKGAAGAPLLIVGDYSRQDTEFSSSSLFGQQEDVMLWNMMRAIGLSPETVYVTNAIKCCPQGSEPPPASAEPCRVHLRREIEWVRPKIICAMGEAAAWAVLGSSETVFRLRGKWHRYRNGKEKGEALPVMVTFHPRYLMANADMKKVAWEDLQMIQRELRSLSKTGRP